MGWKNKKGYGQICICNKRELVHRFTYYANNPHLTRDPKMYVCHRCNNPSCVNIEHLYLADHTTNLRDAFRDGLYCNNAYLRKTHCKNGHEYSKENTLIRSKSGYRQCLTCKRKQEKDWYYKNKNKKQEWSKARSLRNKATWKERKR